MGLDMYLTRKVYIGAEYKYRKVSGKVDIKIDGKKVLIDFNKISYIDERAAYWRKANQIHQWFVNNVQGGVDECQESDVSIEQLRELVELCIKIRDKQVEPSQVLPTSEGFFFGSTDYDEYYMQDIDSTIEQLEPYITDDKYTGDEFSYRASW